MPTRRQTLGPDGSLTSYRSAVCQIGTHRACSESTPNSAPVDLPLIYEACACLCHAVPDPSRGGDDTARNSASSGASVPTIEATDGGAQG